MGTGYRRNINRNEMDTVKTIRKVERIVKLEAICLREIRETRMDYHGIPVRNLRTASLKVPLAILHPPVFNRQISTIFHQTRIYSNLPPYRILSKPSRRTFHAISSLIIFLTFFPILLSNDRTSIILRDLFTGGDERRAMITKQTENFHASSDWESKDRAERCRETGSGAEK